MISIFGSDVKKVFYPRVVMLSAAFTCLAQIGSAQEGDPWAYGELGYLYYGYCYPIPSDSYEAETCASYLLNCIDERFEIAISVSDVGDDEQEAPDGRKILYDLMNGNYEGYEDFTGRLIVQPQNLQSPLYFDKVELGSPGGDTPMRVLLTSRNFEAFDAIMSIPSVESLDLRIGQTDIRLFSMESERQLVANFMEDCSNGQDDSF